MKVSRERSLALCCWRKAGVLGRGWRMSVVGMRRFGRQNQKEEGFGSLALVSSALLVLDVFGSRARTSAYFAFAPTDTKC